jgi:predicted MPP superfamily phosphohydrolase
MIAFFLFIEYYVFAAIWRVIRKLNSKYRILILVFNGLVTLAIFGGFYAMRLWSETSWPSVMLKFGVNVLMGIFIGKFLVALIMLLGDILLFFRFLVKKIIAFAGKTKKASNPEGKFITRSAFISKTALACGALLTSGLVYGMVNRYRYSVRRVRLALQGLPESLKGFRIVQVSDIHSGSFDDKEAVTAGIDIMLREKPDLILFTGDLVNFRSDEIIPYMEVFSRLNAPLGVYSILGNHDYGEYVDWPSPEDKKNDLEKLKSYHKAMGWQLLMNEHILIEKNGQQIGLIGVENWSAKARFTKYGDLKKAMAGLEKSPVHLKILMSHDPSHWDAEVLRDYPDIALTLSGHTHGMQFGVEIPGFKWSPVQYLYKEWAGLYSKKSQYLYVNRGFGFIGYQGRLGILPEITVIDLV